MATQWPLVAAQLMATLPTLPGWQGVRVFDGPPESQTRPDNYVIVGHVLDNADAAGSFTTEQDRDGFHWMESGHLVNQLTCQTGSRVAGGDKLGTVRSRAFNLLDAFEAYIRSNRTLGGVLSAEGTSRLQVDVLDVWNVRHTAQTLHFTVSYTTVT